MKSSSTLSHPCKKGHERWPTNWHLDKNKDICGSQDELKKDIQTGQKQLGKGLKSKKVT